MRYIYFVAFRCLKDGPAYGNMQAVCPAPIQDFADVQHIQTLINQEPGVSEACVRFYTLLRTEDVEA